MSPTDTSKEEFKAISNIKADSYTPTDVYDPICDNYFALYESIAKGTPYHPRLGHTAYVKGEKEAPDDNLKNFSKKPSFNIAWPTQYMLA
jgi:hypothetical protein